MRKYSYEEENSKHYRLSENKQKYRIYSSRDEKKLKINILFRIPFTLYFIGKRYDIDKYVLFTKESDMTLFDIYFWREV